MLINFCSSMCYRLYALFLIVISCLFQPKSLLFNTNLHAFTLQCHVFCGAKWCLLSFHLIAFAGKAVFSDRIITCLRPVCLLIFSKLKLLKTLFEGIICAKYSTNRVVRVTCIPCSTTNLVRWKVTDVLTNKSSYRIDSFTKTLVFIHFMAHVLCFICKICCLYVYTLLSATFLFNCITLLVIVGAWDGNINVMMFQK